VSCYEILSYSLALWTAGLMFLTHCNIRNFWLQIEDTLI
jgi:hypothetical protein